MKTCRYIPESTPSPFFLFLIVFLCLCIWGGSNAFAQQTDVCAGALAAAKKDYQSGLFDKASFRLSSCISRKAFDAVSEKAAYLLLGQIYHANLEEEKARNSVRLLLEQDPSLELNPQEHKQEFIDFVDDVLSEMHNEEAAKPRSNRRGFWLSAGLGPAEGNIRCDCPPAIDAAIPDDHPWKGGSSGSLVLAAGGTVSPKLQLGGEISVWSRSREGVNNTFTSTIAFLSFIAKYYPGESGNFFLKGGVGFGSAALENDTIKLQSGGAGLEFGLGYDFHIGRDKKMAISPIMNLNVLYAAEDVVFVNNFRLQGPTEPSFFQVGVAVTFL